MKRITAIILCFLFISPMALGVGAPTEELWTRTEPGGHYVTVRVPCPQGSGLSWGEVGQLSLRYADTKTPVPLTSDYLSGYLFATLPVSEKDRPLEVFQGEEHRFPDCVVQWGDEQGYDSPAGTSDLQLRGIIQGDAQGSLNPKASLTRAEAFALACRLLSLEAPEDAVLPFRDVDRSDWYYATAAAAYAHGLASADDNFYPHRPVTRGEFTTILARAMEHIGWLSIPENGQAQDLSLADAASIPSWALGAYLAFDGGDIGIFTQRETGEVNEDGSTKMELLAQWNKIATRGEAITFLHFARIQLPWYPSQYAIDWGLSQQMPVLDGSTSTYPYTQAVYGVLFHNSNHHPQYVEKHSTSHDSYVRLIQGEADILFAATLPSEDLKAQAAAAGVELEFIPIAYDAMVFFTNKINSLDSLTQKQIQEIYVDGKYQNWNQLGGPDAELLPYRRNADSGSHALMEQYFLEGGKLSLSPDVNNVLTSYAMSSALTDVADALRTDPPAYAIGYSVYYYYTRSYRLVDEVSAGGLKLLAIDGVVPSDATIADGSYPLAGYNYAVVRADEPKDSLARRMVEFMTGDVGQNCVGNAGFGPLSSGPKADFQRDFPHRELETVFPAGVGYVALSWDKDHTQLQAHGLERRNGDGHWHPLTENQCPAPPEGGLSAAVLGPAGHTVVFGAVGGQWDNMPSLRLSYGDGQQVTQSVYAGQTFYFSLEGQPKLEKLELLYRGEVVATHTFPAA